MGSNYRGEGINIFNMQTSSLMTWAGHVAHYGGEEGHIQGFGGET
jgi:hypothetical protein